LYGFGQEISVRHLLTPDLTRSPGPGLDRTSVVIKGVALSSRQYCTKGKNHLLSLAEGKAGLAYTFGRGVYYICLSSGPGIRQLSKIKSGSRDSGEGETTKGTVNRSRNSNLKKGCDF
jgi:hypothetical protein